MGKLGTYSVDYLTERASVLMNRGVLLTLCQTTPEKLARIDSGRMVVAAFTNRRPLIGRYGGLERRSNVGRYVVFRNYARARDSAFPDVRVKSHSAKYACPLSELVRLYFVS